MSVLVDKGLKAKRESKIIDFKSSFDPTSTGEWCELIKDIVAMANSGGGAILIGVDNGGSASKADVRPLLDLDHAKILDKIRKYTGTELVDVEVHEAEKDGQTVAILEIVSARTPIVFHEVGTYEIAGAKQKTAFSKGTVYFRHGAKSEPGTTEDIRTTIERQLHAIRGEWLDGVRKVVTAPQGSSVTVFSGEVRESSAADATPIRLVDDPNAPGYRLIDHDTTYPHRQKEIIPVINGMLPSGVNITTYDLLAVRRVHAIDGDSRYSHAPKFGSTQYSDNFATWVVDQHKADQQFFAKARKQYKGSGS